MVYRQGMSRARLREGSGKGIEIADEHFSEVVGSKDFYIYVTPNRKVKGYEGLRDWLQELGYAVTVSDSAPMLPAKGYKAIKVTTGDGVLSDDALKRAHRWAHQRNFLHSFFKPLRNR
jgi:L-amino acid N-acyltransferase YncA